MNKKIVGSLLGLISIVCMLSLILAPVSSDAAEIKKLEKEAAQLQSELSGINEEILDLGTQVAEAEEKIASADAKIEQKEEQLAIAKVDEEKRYNDMSLRIKYMYENDTESWIEYIFSAESLSDFLNNVEYVQRVMEYDRQKLEDLHSLQKTIADEQTEIKKERESFISLKEELKEKENALNAKAKETSTDISGLTAKISSLRAAEAEAAAKKEALKKQEQKKEEQKQESSSKPSNSGSSSSSKPSSGSSSSGSSSSGGYTYSSTGLTPWKGVVYYDGHRETYYSQRVLPGGGLNIPGRHVAGDGTIRDADGYICVASNDYPRGTVVNTSLGPGKVYDCGCASGTIDLYTDW